jgi:diaminohydroxyphosphoribosylaminopyrimidine deaminase/5-amino-6-(5-phosphoribosylamino)uracil reductase
MKTPDGNDYKLLKTGAGTLFVSSIDQLLKKLYELGIQSLLVEGGSKLLQSFIDRGLWDEAYVETGNIIIGEGIASPTLKTI